MISTRYSNRLTFDFTDLHPGDLERVRIALFPQGKVSAWYIDYLATGQGRGYLTIATDLDRPALLEILQKLGLAPRLTARHAAEIAQMQARPTGKE
jgi:hypothetical protein